MVQFHRYNGLMETLLSPASMGSILKVISVLPKSAAPHVPVPVMLSTAGGERVRAGGGCKHKHALLVSQLLLPQLSEGHTDSERQDAEILDRAEFDPGFDYEFQLRRLEEQVLAAKQAAEAALAACRKRDDREGMPGLTEFDAAAAATSSSAEALTPARQLVHPAWRKQHEHLLRLAMD